MAGIARGRSAFTNMTRGRDQTAMIVTSAASRRGCTSWRPT
ncbi:MAG: hypothetical protein Q4E45_05650 [Eubacteriales bacterium]|nr:hypothetical protein [Eubacteriales bacterium]